MTNASSMKITAGLALMMASFAVSTAAEARSGMGSHGSQSFGQPAARSRVQDHRVGSGERPGPGHHPPTRWEQPANRPHVQDHRNGGAASSGTHIRCVIFCGNTFTPNGPRPRQQVQDHRSGIPIVNSNGNRVGSGTINPATTAANGGPRITIVDNNGNRVGSAPAPRTQAPGRPVLVDSTGRRLRDDRTPLRPRDPGYTGYYSSNSGKPASAGYPAPAGNIHPNHMPHLLQQ